MNARPTLLPRGVAWVQACGVLFLLAGLALAEGAAAANFLAKIPVEPAIGILIAGAALYLLLAVAALFGMRWIFRRCGAGIFLGTAVGLSLLIQFSAIRAADPRWAWTGDARIFEQYLADLSATGYAPATLERLSQFYDYRVWTKRALPFYYSLRIVAGDRFVPAAQAFQAVLLALALLLSWRIARRLFGTRAAFWTVAFQWLMPYRWFICLDLNHHVLGGFYFLAGLGLLVEWLQPNRRPFATAGLVLIAAGLLPLMRLEGGIDVVFAGAALLVLLLAWLAGRQSARQTLGSAVCLLAFPLLVSARLLAPLEQRIEAADRHHHESGAIAFMARGWAPETGGEYCGTYETIDYLTARADKKSVQAAILASQAFYNPRVLLTHLLPTKMAKYFLLGYASGAEECWSRTARGGPRRWPKAPGRRFCWRCCRSCSGAVGCFCPACAATAGCRWSRPASCWPPRTCCWAKRRPAIPSTSNRSCSCSPRCRSPCPPPAAAHWPARPFGRGSPPRWA